MKLPDYFLADLPPEATLSSSLIGEACLALKRNRERFLAGRTTQSLIHTLSGVAARWLDPAYPLRKIALDQGPAATGFSPATLAAGLDTFFRQLTPAGFQALLEQDLGHARRLDGVVAADTEQQGGRAAMALGPSFLLQIAAGNLPNPTLMSMVLGLLVRSAQFVKCASGTSLLPRLFAHSIHEAEPKLGACLEVAEWKGGNRDLEQVLFEEADCVTATGSDETLADIRRRLPARTRFLGYGHRLSFAYVSGEVLGGRQGAEVAACAAADVAAWDQQGCLSPHVIYVEQGGMTTAELFAELLARELAARESVEPRGELSASAAAAIASRRSIYELRAAHSPDTRLWCSPGSTAWTVVYEADPRFQISCLNRFIYVKPVTSLAAALESADSVRHKVSTVGVAVPEARTKDTFAALARWGVPRVCRLGRMQNPPLTWRHDGRPALGELVTWADYENGVAENLSI